MCKFNNRLFVFAFICLLGLVKVRVLAKPIQEAHKHSNDDFKELMALTSLLAPQDNYDLHYDQRQKGEENYRIKLDGFVIGLPADASSVLLYLPDNILEDIADFGTVLGRNKVHSLKTPEKVKPLASLDSNQELKHLPQNDSLKNPDGIVEIPAPKKPSEAGHFIDLEDEEEHSNKSVYRPRSYISHLVSLFKRGRKN